MNKLSIPANRLKFYKKLLEVVCEDPSVKRGYCFYLSKAYRMTFSGSGLSESVFNSGLEKLPELIKYRPKGKTNLEHWFPCTTKGWEKRISILEEIIKDMGKNLRIK